VKIEGTTAKISVSIPESFRNSFVQPELTVYGPALESVKSADARVEYAGVTQPSLLVESDEEGSMSVSGTFETLTVRGSGSIDLGGSSVQVLKVESKQNASITAGTVRELTVTQPDVCPSNVSSDNTQVHVAGVTAGTMTYNGVAMEAVSHQTSCASVVIGDENYYEAFSEN
jgi:hypothetical protein